MSAADDVALLAEEMVDIVLSHQGMDGGDPHAVIEKLLRDRDERRRVEMTDPDSSTFGERLRAEAAIAARSGQGDRLDALAAEVDHEIARLNADAHYRARRDEEFARAETREAALDTIRVAFHRCFRTETSDPGSVTWENDAAIQAFAREVTMALADTTAQEN